jgi:hypothetical protein
LFALAVRGLLSAWFLKRGVCLGILMKESVRESGGAICVGRNAVGVGDGY